MITSISIAVLNIAVALVSLCSVFHTYSLRRLESENRDLRRRLEDLECARDEQLDNASKVSSREEFERAGGF